MNKRELFVEIDKDELLHQALDEFEDYRVHLIQSSAYLNLPEFKEVLREREEQFDTFEFKQRVQRFLFKAAELQKAMAAQATTGQAATTS